MEPAPLLRERERERETAEKTELSLLSGPIGLRITFVCASSVAASANHE